MKFKKIGSLAIASFVAVTFTACSGGATAGGDAPSENTSKSEASDTSADAEASTGTETIKIGSVGPLTGPNAQYGNETFNGVNLAFEESGLDVEFITYDDKADPAEATNLYQRLVSNDGVNLFLGAVTSGSTAAVASASQADGIPVLSPTATQDDVTLLGDNVFRACFKDSFQGEVLAKYAFEELGITSTAVLYNNALDYSTGLAEAFETTFVSLGGEVVASESYSDTDVDFKTQLNGIAAKEPQALFLPDYYEKIALLGKQVHDLGMDVTLLGADGWIGVMDVVEDPAYLNGAYVVNNFSTEDETPIVQEFIANYTEKYGVAPTGFSASGYDAAKIALDAIERAGSTDYDAIINALKETNIDSVGGNITFDENGDPLKGALILEVIDGTMTLVNKTN
ncbi:MAG: ABC transporter substrate-binding protein [Lachnospirales bacterium]